MRSETLRCLELVEAALDPAHLARTRQLWDDCRHYRPIPHLPLVCMCPAPDWPQYSMDEIQSDREKMLVSELAHVYAACLVRDDTLPSIRANYGTGILRMSPPVVMEDEVLMKGLEIIDEAIGETEKELGY